MTPPAVRAGYAYLEGTLTTSPDSQAAYGTIDRVRSAVHAVPGSNAVLATIPSTELTEIGFAVAFGILLDTIVVRSVLVTALNLDVGRWMWWPSKLAQKPDPAPDELSRERAVATVAS